MRLFRTKGKKVITFLKSENYPYKELLENNMDPVYLLDTNGLFIKLNTSFQEITGYTEEELIGTQFLKIVHIDDHFKAKSELIQNLNGNTLSVQEYKVIKKDSEIKTIRLNQKPITFNGEIIGVIGITISIIEEKELDLKQTIQNDVNKSLNKYSSEIIGILDSDGKLIYRSPSAQNVLGYKADEMSASFFSIMHPDDISAATYSLSDLTKNYNKTINLELRLKHKNGEWRYFSVIGINCLKDPDIKGIVFKYHDITTIKKAQEELHYMAYYDSLTNLPNKKYLDDKLISELVFAKKHDLKFAIISLDLDRFKYLNDSLGYEIGDKVLQKVANKLKTCISDKGTLSRLSGDKFVIVISDIVSIEEINEITNKINQKFEHPLLINDFELYITTSIGISIYPESGEDIPTLMKNADLAMYLAKEKGNNNIEIFSPTMNVKMYKTFTLQNDLRKAIKTNQFELNYQPIVNAKTFEISGVEALIRWKHPDWGGIPPNDFIYLAEETGLIIPLGNWIIRNVCEQLKLWRKLGFAPIRMSINCSVIEILQKDFVKKVATVLSEFQVEGKWLAIEITESNILDQVDDVLYVVNGLKELGIKLYLDDFGTGYSALGYLKKYRFDTIKLDKNFFDDIHTNFESEAIVQFIINLSNQLNINVIAEGVENKEQLEKLYKLGCKEVQGYLFSKPVPVTEFEELLKLKTLKPIGSNESHSIEKRKSFRLNLPNPIEADMTLLELNNKKVQVGSTKVLVQDIGPGGMRFTSEIKLPSTVHILLMFTTTILGVNVTYKGEIVWHKEDKDIYCYGVEYSPERTNCINNINILYKLQLKVKKNTLLENTRIIKQNAEDYFSQN